MSSQRSAILAVVLVAVGALAARMAAADEPPPPPPRLTERCHLFTITDLDKDRDLITADRSSEVGQWVAAREAEGWALQGVDLEIGQKPTGYPVGYQNVCMVRPASAP